MQAAFDAPSSEMQAFLSTLTASHDLTRAESEAFLSMLLEHVGSPEFQCRHRWTGPTLTMWDDRCVQH